MSGNNERLNDGFIEVIRDAKIPSKVRLKKAKYLVRLGADVNAMLYGRSAVYWAKETGDEEMVEFLREKGGKFKEITKEEAKRLVRILIVLRIN